MEKVYTVEDYQKGVQVDRRTEVVPGARQALWSLANLIDPLDWAEVFAREAPVELDLGCGDGSFLLEYAGRHPERNFLGVERLMGRLNKIIRKRQRLGLENVKACRIESAYLLKYLLRSGSLQAIHLYFPDPWPKRRHERHRLVQSDFVGSCLKALRPGGGIYLRSDHALYFEQMCQFFDQEPGFAAVQTPEELRELQTDFEKQWRAQGLEIHYAAYGKKEPPAPQPGLSSGQTGNETHI